jgi:uncharacterized membrane protein YeaQ/YmgE (transglycosylase-associated protein family)
MSFIAWIVLGLIAGFIASKIVNKSGEGMILDIILGIVGAVIGGYLFQTFGMAGVSLWAFGKNCNDNESNQSVARARR